MENINHQSKSAQPIAQKYVPDDNTTYRPILSYTYYIFLRLIKNKSTWILLIISFIVSMLLGILPILISKVPSEIALGLSVMGTVGPMIITIFSMVFGVIKSLNIFSDSQSDGTELLIVSKPITRTQLIITRFIFLLIVGLIFSLLVFLAWTIGLAIVGFEHVNDVTVSLLGVWASSFISFMMTSVITIFIALKFSSRAARVLPLVIMSISAIVGVVPIVTSLLFNSGVSSNQIQNITRTVNANYAKRNDKFKLSRSFGTDLIVEDFSFSSSFDSSYNSPFKLKNDNNEYHLYLTKFAINQNKPGFNDSAYFTLGNLLKDNSSGPGTINEWKIIYNYVSEQAAIALKEYSVNANPITAISFINPMSAFNTIAGTTDDNMLSSAFGSIEGAYFNSNYSYNNFVYDNKAVSVNENSYNISGADYNNQLITISLPSAIKIDKVTQVDSPLFVGILWFGIFIVTISLCVIVYFRKDFK